MTELKLEMRNLIVQLTEEEAKQRADLAAECADVAGQAESRAALLGEQAKAAKKEAEAKQKEAETKQKEAGRLLAVYRVFVNERRWSNASDAGMHNPEYQIPVSLR